MIKKQLQALGEYLLLMGRTFQRPERMRMFFKQYYHEVTTLGINSVGIVLLISLFIGAVICIQIKLNIQSAWMPSWVSGYTTREIMMLEFSSAIMCLILAGKVGSNIASEIGTMRITQQIDALPHPAQGGCAGQLHTHIGHLQRGCRHSGCLLHRLSGQHYHSRRSDAGTAA